MSTWTQNFSPRLVGLTADSGVSRGGRGGAMAPPEFGLAPRLAPPSFYFHGLIINKANCNTTLIKFSLGFAKISRAGRFQFSDFFSKGF